MIFLGGPFVTTTDQSRSRVEGGRPSRLHESAWSATVHAESSGELAPRDDDDGDDGDGNDDNDVDYENSYFVDHTEAPQSN